MEMTNLTALSLAEEIRKKNITPTEAVRAFFEKAQQSRLNCYVSLDLESALATAKEVEIRLQNGEKLSPLAGVPVAIKDNICEKGKVTSAGSRMLKDFIPPYDATVITKVKNAGMIPLGKTNMDEFAMGWSTETSAYGVTKNPWDMTRVAGGSSGGSAAAVAAGESVLALGSDTGGSIRQPCAFCGVTGLKATYGAVSRYGLIAFASSLDTIGTVGRDAADCAALFDIIKGADDKDLTTLSVPDAKPLTDLKGVKIAVLGDCTKQAKELENLGAVCEEIALPELRYAVSAYYIIACAEASSNLARYDGVKYGYRNRDAEALDEMYVLSRSEGFGTEAKKRMMLGNFVLSAGYFDDYYRKALRVKRILCDAFANVFARYDMILSPVTDGAAYKIGAAPENLFLSDWYTAAVNLAGLPALALPCGFDSEGLPHGVQLIGKPFGEKVLLSAGKIYQSATDYHTKRPKVNNEL